MNLYCVNQNLCATQDTASASLVTSCNFPNKFKGRLPVSLKKYL